MSTPTSGTSTQLEVEARTESPTASNVNTIRRLQRSYDELTGPVRILTEDVESGRREVREWDLDERTAAKSRMDVLALLEELSTDRGFSWSDIARLCGVSVSAVRKWRSGENPSPERRRDLARLTAFVDLLEEIAPVADPATWMLMRLVDRHTVTAADLYLDGRSNDLLEHAQGHLGVNDLLDRWNPDWRTNTESGWEVVTASDGERSITRRS
jgi:transcriptional regulator with XRE-family HTH domain